MNLIVGMAAEWLEYVNIFLGLRGIEWAIFDVEGLTNRHIT
jgi:hypothetical protein